MTSAHVSGSSKISAPSRSLTGVVKFFQTLLVNIQIVIILLSVVYASRHLKFDFVGNVRKVLETCRFEIQVLIVSSVLFFASFNLSRSGSQKCGAQLAPTASDVPCTSDGSHDRVDEDNHVVKLPAKLEHGTPLPHTAISPAPRNVINRSLQQPQKSDDECEGAAAQSQYTFELMHIADAAIGHAEGPFKSMQNYRDLRRKDCLHLLKDELMHAESKHSVTDYFASMIQCAGRAGDTDLVMTLVNDMDVLGVEPPLSVYESAMRLLAAKKCYAGALAVYDIVERDRHRRGFTQPSTITLSCLVGFAVEVEEYDRAVTYFNHLSEIQTPSIKACMNILRVHVARNDWEASVSVLRSLRCSGATVDALALNKVLSLGVSLDLLTEVEEMITEESIADVVSYNILLKGLARAGQARKAARTIDLMRARGIAANTITYNTAMDAAVRTQQHDQAWSLYSALIADALQPDICTCTILMKTLQPRIAPERVSSILELLELVHRLKVCSPSLGVRMLRSAMSAAVELPGHLQIAMRCFALMRDQKVEASAHELRALLRKTAEAEDVDGCRTLLVHARLCEDLDGARAGIDWLIAEQGLRVDHAVLQVLDKLNLKLRGKDCDAGGLPRR